MAVPVLKGWADEIEPGLAKISEAVKKFGNPNVEIQQELKRRIAADPTLIQKLQDAEALNPGSVTSTFGKEAMNILSGKASFDVETELKKRGGKTVDQLKGDNSLAGQRALIDTTGKDTTGHRSAAATAITQEAAARVAPKKAEFELAQIEDELPHVAAMGKAHRQKVEYDLKEAEGQAKKAEEYLKAIPQLKGVDFNGLANAIVDQKMTPELAEKLQIVSSAGQDRALGEMVSAIQRSRDRALQRELHNDGEKRLDNQIQLELMREWQKTGRPGNLTAFKSYMMNPKAQERAQQLYAKGQKTGDTLDDALFDIQHKITTDQRFGTGMQVNKLNMQLFAAQSMYDKAKGEADKSAAALQVNQTLQQLQELGVIDKSIVFNPKSPWFSKNQVFAKVDENGDQHPYGKEDLEKDIINKVLKFTTEEKPKADSTQTKSDSTSTDFTDQWAAMDPETYKKSLAALSPADRAKVQAGMAKRKKK